MIYMYTHVNTNLWMCSLFCDFSCAQEFHDVLGSLGYSGLYPGVVTQLLHPQVQRADDGFVWRMKKDMTLYLETKLFTRLCVDFVVILYLCFCLWAALILCGSLNVSQGSPITSLLSKLSSLAWLALRICILMNSIFVLLSWSICWAVASNLRSCEWNETIWTIESRVFNNVLFSWIE